jgi:hypothetical protein
MSNVVAEDLVVILGCLASLGWWAIVTRRRGTPPFPFRRLLLTVLVVAGTWLFALTGHAVGHTQDYGVIFAAFVIALFQLPDPAPTPRTNLFRRVFTVLGAWWILYRG